MLDTLVGRFSRFPFVPSPALAKPLPPLFDRFGLRSPSQLARDLREVVAGAATGDRFQFDLGSAGLLRPDISLAAYAGLVPKDGLAPVFNLFDRHGGGQRFTQRVSRATARDFRGGKLSYDEHDGTDLVCPIGTPLVAAAPGVVVMVRDRFLRGGLTMAVDHGGGVVTQYTHCARAVAPLGTFVARGETVALSGAAGLDMVQFFPWVPPHIHFMVYVDGVPCDPFLAPGEAVRAGLWLSQSAPAPSGVLPGDPPEVAASDVDASAIARVAAGCTDARIRDEIAACDGSLPCLAALLEDALAHDAWAFAPDVRRLGVRPPPTDERRAAARAIALTLPLPSSVYRGLRFADSRFTAPEARV